MPALIEDLLPWTAEREALTVAYLRAHRTAPLTGDPDRDTRMVPRAIVLHWTAGPTAASARATFAPARLAGRADLADAGALNVGAHFLVDRDGAITRLAPDDRVLRHCIGLNLTEAQVVANVALVRGLASRHPIEVLLGHLEYRRMEGSPLFEERDPAYRTAKPDPGAEFMARVRAGVADLGLGAPPP
jgi:N-acetylmuramoyl-L-alanine amidase